MKSLSITLVALTVCIFLVSTSEAGGFGKPNFGGGKSQQGGSSSKWSSGNVGQKLQQFTGRNSHNSKPLHHNANNGHHHNQIQHHIANNGHRNQIQHHNADNGHRNQIQHHNANNGHHNQIQHHNANNGHHNQIQHHNANYGHYASWFATPQPTGKVHNSNQLSLWIGGN